MATDRSKNDEQHDLEGNPKRPRMDEATNVSTPDETLLLDRLQAELDRIDARLVRVSIDHDFEPQAGRLIKVQLESAYWHLFPNDLMTILEDIPDQSGDESVKTAIEMNAMIVWHGPSPESRDTSP